MNSTALADSTRLVYYFGVFRDDQIESCWGKTGNPVQRRIQGCFLSVIDDTLRMVADRVLKLDNHFDFLITGSHIYVLHPTAFERIAELELSAAPAVRRRQDDAGESARLINRPQQLDTPAARSSRTRLADQPPLPGMRRASTLMGWSTPSSRSQVGSVPWRRNSRPFATCRGRQLSSGSTLARTSSMSSGSTSWSADTAPTMPARHAAAVLRSGAGCHCRNGSLPGITMALASCRPAGTRSGSSPPSSSNPTSSRTRTT
jgi:hypothetical protein